MRENQSILKTAAQARQGMRVKGMSTVLTASISAAAVAMLIVGLIAAQG